MTPIRILLDSNIFDELAVDPDTQAVTTDLQTGGKIKLIIMRGIEDQLAEAPPNVRKTAKALHLTIVSTSGFVFDVSKWDEAD